MSKKHSRVPRMRRPRTPSWKVVAVGFGVCHEPNCTIDHDDEDPADAVAYTVGLHEGQQLPEVYLRAAPEDDSEPLDYVTAGRMVGLLARGVASRLYQPGHWVTIDGVPGYGDLSFRLGEPADADEVNAFAAHADATVIPVDWAPHSSFSPPPSPRSHSHDRSITVGAREGAKIVYIQYSEAKLADHDTGFILEYEGAPPPWAYTEKTFGALCTGCLIDDYPEVAPGLELARRWGSAALVDGKWASSDKSGEIREAPTA